MQAITQNKYGLSETLELKDIPSPAPRPNEVLIKVSATSVDAGVLHLMTGDIPLVRLFFGIKTPRNRPGISFSGTIVEIGSNVTEFKIGQQVFGTGAGAYAEFVVASKKKIAVLPPGADMVLASTLPVSAGTALQAVRNSGKIRAGQRVLVTGASGGVGSFVVQFAVQEGGIVTGVCSAKKIEFVSQLGAIQVIDYQSEKISGTYDVIIDIASPLSLSETKRLLTPGGTLVIVGAASRHGSSGIARNIGARLRSLFARESLFGIMQSENKADLEKLSVLLEQGKLAPVVDKIYSLAETKNAIDYFASGKSKGKIVIKVSD